MLRFSSIDLITFRPCSMLQHVVHQTSRSIVYFPTSTSRETPKIAANPGSGLTAHQNSMAVGHHSIQSICLTRLECSSGANSLSQLLEDFNRRFPADAGVGNADTFLQLGWSFGRNLLVSFVDVGLNHHANNSRLALPNLITDDLSNLGLVAMVLVGIT